MNHYNINIDKISQSHRDNPNIAVDNDDIDDDFVCDSARTTSNKFEK